MKRIIINEKQYNKLIRNKLNEDYVFEDPKDLKDVSDNMIIILTFMANEFYEKYKKDLFIKSVQDGIVTINGDKYDEDEKKTIVDSFNYWVKTTNSFDEKVKNQDKMEFDFDEDSDYEDTIAQAKKTYYDRYPKKELIKTREIDKKTSDEDEEEITVYIASDEFPGIPSNWLPLAKLIASKEASSFTSLNPNTTLEEKGLKNATEKTIQEVQDFLDKKNMGDNAVGRWQFKNILKKAKSAGLSPDDKFSPKNQGKIFMYLVNVKRDVTAESIKRNINDSAKSLAMEWAVLPVLESTDGANGKSITRGYTYWGDKSKITPEEFTNALLYAANQKTINVEPKDDEKSTVSSGEINIVPLLNKGKSFDSEKNVTPECVDERMLCMGGNNGDWDGSVYKAAVIAYYLNQCDSRLKPGSQKRSKQKTASNHNSDHWVKSLNSYAIDVPSISDSLGDKGFYCLKEILSNKGMISGNTLENFKGERGHYNNFNYGGYRYQILWKSDDDHDDHIHVGVRKN